MNTPVGMTILLQVNDGDFHDAMIVIRRALEPRYFCSVNFPGVRGNRRFNFEAGLHFIGAIAALENSPVAQSW